ncbi:MAG: hypothetical protein IJE89_02185 [Bacilli bacterium]|nr:hypothetical protein [Bacilli bacterium]
MKLLDKIKDLFMDEISEEDDLELEEENVKVYEEPKDVLPKVMRDNIKKEEENIKFEELKPRNEEVKKKEEIVVPEKKFTFPIEFEEDIMPTRSANKNVLKVTQETSKKVTELYPKKEEVKEKPRFKPTPVISPVYGILDKNYTKEEVREKSEDNMDMKRPSKKVDFETVRKKAFGNLTDEIKDNLMCENCELYKEVKRISAVSSDDLLYDMLVSEDKKEEPITIEKAYDNYEDFGVLYEPKKEEIKNEGNTTIINNNVEVNIAEKIEIEEKTEEDNRVIEVKKIEEEKEPIVEKLPSRQEKNKENKVDEDFFDLIDSMYKERIDE